MTWTCIERTLEEVDPSTGCSTQECFLDIHFGLCNGWSKSSFTNCSNIGASMANANPSKKRRGDEEDMMDEDDWMADFMSGGGSEFSR